MGVLIQTTFTTDQGFTLDSLYLSISSYRIMVNPDGLQCVFGLQAFRSRADKLQGRQPIPINQYLQTAEAYTTYDEINRSSLEGIGYKAARSLWAKNGYASIEVYEPGQVTASNYVYDASGFNIDGYNAKGFNAIGYNAKGYDISGFTFQGFNADGYDRTGYNSQGYDVDGYDVKGFARSGYNKYGYDANGYNNQGYNAEGFKANGFNAEGFDHEGYNSQGFNAAGFNAQGFNAAGFNTEGYNAQGFNVEGKNAQGQTIQDLSGAVPMPQ